ncbi:kinase-like domain-containing protein [Mycena sanguinolenta]|nr:kinase-like domain-containing protein [Mycena sanguinolenta]
MENFACLKPGDANISTTSFYVKDTPPPPAGSSVEIIQSTTQFYRTEHEAHIRLQGHPRILCYHGWDNRGLLFDRHPTGDLLRYLLEHRDPPPSLTTRLQWACDIAEGLAFMHSRGVIWVDVSLGNVLISADHRAILCDFAGSRILPVDGQKMLPAEYGESQVSISPIMSMPRYPHALQWQGPGSPYPYPDMLDFTPSDDRFGFGIVLFCLLAFRFPHSNTLVVRDFQMAEKIFHLHHKHVFDSLGNTDGYQDLDAIIQKCFRAEYRSSDDLLIDLRAACDAMPSHGQLLQDKVHDPVLEFPKRESGRDFYPFDVPEDSLI